MYRRVYQLMETQDFEELGLIPGGTDLVVEGVHLGFPLACIPELLKGASDDLFRYKVGSETGIDVLEKVEIASRIILFLNPNHETCLNARKRLVQMGIVHPTTELRNVQLCCTIPRNCKQSLPWHHRRWIHASSHLAYIDPIKERDLCVQVAERYKSNYFAWTYRWWITTRVLARDPRIRETSRVDPRSFVSDEYTKVCAWMERHVSDHSGLHYLERLLASVQDASIKMKHGAWIADLIQSYPGHESLWCHLRYCFSNHIPLSTGDDGDIEQNYTRYVRAQVDAAQRTVNGDFITEDDERQYYFAHTFMLWTLVAPRPETAVVSHQSKAIDATVNDLARARPDLPMYNKSPHLFTKQIMRV